MSIKETALRLAKSMRDKSGYTTLDLVCNAEAFAEALVAELAKENKPVAWMQISVEEGVNESFPRKEKPKKYNSAWWRFEPLYALPPTAPRIEQETAEAIAKMLDDKDVGRTDYCMHVYEEGEQYKSNLIADIKASKWREYL